MSSFTSLNTALTALYAQQRGLDVTGQNVANANTEGYTRQRVTMQAVGASTTPAVWATQSKVGSGVDVTGVQRLRDSFLEARAQAEHGREAAMTTEAEAYARIEQAYGEPGDAGLQKQLEQLWNAFADLGDNPDPTQRTAVLTQAGAVTDGLNRAASYLDTQWQVLREQVVATVEEVNTTASQVAELNGAIRRANQSGLPANELSDRRDQLVMRLADLTGGTVRGGGDGVVDVYLAGQALVRGDAAAPLHVPAANGAVDRPGDDVAVTWDGPGGLPVEVDAGRLGGELSALTRIVPGQLSALDGVATRLRDTVNAVHAEGYDTTGAPGGAFFSGTSARDLRVALTDPARIAASARPGEVDGRNGAALARLREAPTGPDKAYEGLIAGLGTAAKAVNDRLEIQSNLTARVDASREAQSGVNLDEEMVNLISYQHAYEGAARVMTTVDQMLDVLINRTGVVGR